MRQYIVGIDVGGTNIKLGLLNLQCKIIARSHLLTKRFIRNKKRLIQALVDDIRLLIEEKKLTSRDILGIGVGLPGLIHFDHGIVNFLPNIPGWRNVPLKKIIESKLRIPTFLDNDVNLITLGEWEYGAGRGYKNLVCITLGTGVGGGIVLNNALYRGEGFVAGEIGHMPLNEEGLPCNCGGWGCLERTVGNDQLLEKARKIFKNKELKLEDIFYLANQGNARAVEFWEKAALHIGNGLVGVVNLLNPRLIIIGGGVANNFKYLGGTINKVIKKRCMNVQRGMVKIVRNKLGDDAGIIGAGVLVKSLRGNL